MFCVLSSQWVSIIILQWKGKIRSNYTVEGTQNYTGKRLQSCPDPEALVLLFATSISPLLLLHRYDRWAPLPDNTYWVALFPIRPIFEWGG